MKVRIKKYVNLAMVVAVMVGVFIPGDLSQAEDTTEKVSGAEPVLAKQIYGVQCCLRPDRDKWPATEMPKLKAYIPGPGNENLWLATNISQGCRILVDGQWYRYIGPEWTGSVGNYTLSDWIAKAGGFLSVSLGKGYWVSLSDSISLVLALGEHTISLGWAGYKEDPTGKSDREENPILLVSEAVRIQILEPKVPAQKMIPADEHFRRIIELFNSFVYKKPLTEVEQKLGIRTDLRLFYNWRPKFTWEDIPALLELARNDELLDSMPSLTISSYIGRHCRQGMIALWFIEGLRREQLSLIREKQLEEKLHPASYRLPLNPICVKDDMDLSECEQSLDIHRAVLEAYCQWWSLVESLPAGQAAAFYPLDMTDMQWYGTAERWRDQPLEIYEKVSSAGIAAERTVIQWNYNGDKYQAGKILQTIYYTLKDPAAKAPFDSDMLKVQKIVLHYYDSHGVKTRTVEIMPGDVQQGMKKSPDL